MGVHGARAYNVYTNLFTPEGLAQWGDTVTLYLPGSGKAGKEQLQVRLCVRVCACVCVCLHAGQRQCLSQGLRRAWLCCPCAHATAADTPTWTPRHTTPHNVPPRTTHLPQGVPPAVLERQVFTCDPQVVGELLARQDDFPKLWGREGFEVVLQGFAGGCGGQAKGCKQVCVHVVGCSRVTEVSGCAAAVVTPFPAPPPPTGEPPPPTGNGLFTSSTRDDDWKTAHGLLPRGFNQIRIKNFFGVRRAHQRASLARMCVPWRPPRRLAHAPP
jgi:hypothetical protein